MKDYTFTENDLNTNLNELVHETLRELYLASKKVSIYSASHPLSQKAIGRSFVLMDKIFKFKRYFNLYILDGHLHAANIKTRPSVFTDQIMSYMQVLDLNDILFEAGITANQLALFLERFVKRLPSSDFRNLMATYLDEKKLDTISVNSEKGLIIFQNCPRFHGELTGNFSVRFIVGMTIGNDFGRLVTFLQDEGLGLDEFLERHNLDYYPALIAYLIPEKIAAIEAETIIGTLRVRVVEVIGDKKNPGEIDSTALAGLKCLIGALSYHPQREMILDRIGSTLVEKGTGKEVYSEILPETSAIKIESSEKIDQFLYASFNEALPGYDLNGFSDLFSRLLRTGQQGKARSIVNILMNHLAGSNLDSREKALVLFGQMFLLYRMTATDSLIDYTISKIGEYISEEKDTFEFSDLIWELAQVTLAEKNYRCLSSLCGLLAGKRTRCQGVWSYESVAVKKAVEELNRREVIEQLVNDLVHGSHTDVPYVKNALTTIGSEEAALALSGIISHESRHVRQHVLKILAEMGKASLSVFSDVMKNNTHFERAINKRELPDEKWYVVRNSIFVLGSLGDPEACRALRLRINDTDTRVRRAIIQALERIGGEQAADLLLVLAADPDQEIREAAILSLGLAGSPDIVPELIDLASKCQSEVINIINIMGVLGGNDARVFLTRLLNDQQLQSRLTSGRSSREDLKLATIKALGRIGDRESIEKIKEFNDSLSASQKILFGGSKLNKAVEEILNRKPN